MTGISVSGFIWSFAQWNNCTRSCFRCRRRPRGIVFGDARRPFTVANCLSTCEEADENVGVEFGGIQIDSAVSEALARRNVRDPSPIQRAALARLSNGETAVLHSETGSGKTIAYLLPIIKNMLESEVKKAYLIIVPSRELGVQVYSEACALLCDESGRVSYLEELNMPRTGTLLVGTAKTVHALSDKFGFKGFFNMFKVIVFDEVDRLIGTVGKHAARAVKQKKKRHTRPASAILERIARDGMECQVIAASATVGRPLKRELASLLNLPMKDGMAVIRPAQDILPEGSSGNGSRLLIPKNIEHICLPVIIDEYSEMMDALAGALVHLNPKKPLIFINKNASITKVIEELRERGFAEATALHEAYGFGKGVTSLESMDKYGKLMSSFNGGDSDLDQSAPILVASEAAARGLHLSHVDVVFLIDCPSDQNEYLHLAGRTGRMGEDGKVVSICSYRKARVMNTWQSQLKVTFKSFKLEGIS
uniref:RNA helicase n=1 Tax=Rhodosorus marinus TaxID=101924 RepID=A0A7S3A3J3_9RHOD|mmetsp:Transcript_41958/g.164389  ORF Transcript_41958/g.164389 Transcript_41958/m.164389 type:complete len:479 (+) Transcript_41958:966-2402(+)